MGTPEILAPQASPPGGTAASGEPGPAGDPGTYSVDDVKAMKWLALRTYAKSIGVSLVDPDTRHVRKQEVLRAACLAYHAEFPSEQGEHDPIVAETPDWVPPPIDDGQPERMVTAAKAFKERTELLDALTERQQDDEQPVAETVAAFQAAKAPVIEAKSLSQMRRLTAQGATVVCGYCSLAIEAGSPCTMTEHGPAHSACHDEMTEEPTPDAPFPEEVTDTVTEDTAPPKQEWHFISRAPAHMEMIDGGEEDRLSGKTLTQARFAKFGDPPHAAGHWITTDKADAQHILDSASFAREDIKLYENFKAKAVAAQMADAEIAMAVGRREPAPARPPLVAKYLRQLGLDPVEAPGKVQISGSRALTGSSRGKSAGQPPSRPDVALPTGVYEAPEHSMLDLTDPGTTFIG